MINSRKDVLYKLREEICMTTIYKKRFINRYCIVSIFVLFILLILSYIVDSEMIKVLLADYSDGLTDGQSEYQVKKVIIDSELYWEYWIKCGIWYNKEILPIYAIFSALPFFYEIRTIFKLGANRFRNRRVELKKAIISYGIMGGGCISVGLFLYFLIGCYFCKTQLNTLGGFEAIFEYNLYHNHPFLFLCFMVFTIYFLFGMLFAIMTCGSVLCFENKITAILFPMTVYIVGSYIGNGFDIRILQVSSCVTVFNTEHTTLECFLPLLSLLLINIVLVGLGVKKNEKIVL